MTFPPNGMSEASFTVSDIISLNDLSSASKHCLFVIRASSQIIREVSTSSLASLVPRLISHMELSSRSIGILNLE